MENCLRWTTSHNIPTEPDIYNFISLKSTVIDHNIYFASTYYSHVRRERRSQITIFDTETLEAVKLQSDLKFPLDHHIYNIASYNGKLYIITMNTYENYKLFTFDIISMGLTELLDLGGSLRGQIQVIGDFMYLIKDNAIGASLLLVKIDLTNMNVEIIPLKISAYEFVHLFSRNNTLHFYTQLMDRNQAVYRINEDNELFQLLKFEDQNVNWPESRKWIMNTQLSIGVNLENYVLETIDLEEHSWISAPIEKCDDEKKELKLGERIENTIYVLFVTESFPLPPKLEIRILELRPTLVDVCFLQIVDELVPEMDKKKMEIVLAKLPIALGRKLINMMEWRNAKKFEWAANFFST